MLASLRPVWVITRREVRDQFRDWRICDRNAAQEDSGEAGRLDVHAVRREHLAERP